MRQLTFIKPGDFEWWDVASPKIAAETDAIVHPIAAARCDLDFYIATGAVKYPGPLAFGHEMVGPI
jgi:alcohol dehydrogenase